MRTCCIPARWLPTRSWVLHSGSCSDVSRGVKLPPNPRHPGVNHDRHEIAARPASAAEAKLGRRSFVLRELESGEIGLAARAPDGAPAFLPGGVQRRLRFGSLALHAE